MAESKNKNVRSKKKRLTKAELARKNANKKLVIFSIAMLLIIITALRLGPLGVTLYNIVRVLVGSLAYPLLVLVTITLFVTMTRQKLIKPSAKSTTGIIIIFIGLLMIYQARFTNHHPNADTWAIISSDLKASKVSNFLGGGMIGKYLYGFVDGLLSKPGVYLLSIFLEVLGLFLVIPSFFYKSGAKLKEYSSNKASDIKAKQPEKKARREEKRQDKEAKKLARQEKAEDKKNQESKSDLLNIFEEDNLPFYDEETGEILDDEVKEPEINIGQPQQEQVLEEQDMEVLEEDQADIDFRANQNQINDNYKLPTIDLLEKIPPKNQTNEKKVVKENIQILQDTFKSFSIDARVESAVVGPSVTKYEIKPATGVRVNRIANLSDDLALALAAKDVRIEAPIPGKSLIGIEVPNSEVATVSFADMWVHGKTSSDKLLELPLGKAVDGSIRTFDLAKMPHLLVAGSTGSGKSVAVNGIITSILMKARPSEVKFLMIDPKMVELSVYNDIPHLLIPVVTNPRKASRALQKVVDEMENRYELFSKFGVRNIEGYNKKVEEANQDSEYKTQTLPLIVVIVDELSDLMMVASKEVEDAIIRLGQKARAAGIHMILATQRPSVDVISGLIKANVPSRVAFAVSSGTDSRTIIDTNGAEKLLGRGDMLFKPIDENHPLRLQGAFLSDDDVERVVNFVKNQESASYDENFDPGDEADQDSSGYNSQLDSGDPLFEEAKSLVIDSQKASASMLQRRLSTGFNRATRIMEELEQAGIIGPAEGTKPRKVLVGKNSIVEDLGNE